MSAESRIDRWGIETNITKRREDGTEHHPESVRLLDELARIDFELCDDYFCWKSGGDGDNGETLMYELDIIFERRDRAKTQET
jgi:hypothetical protein